MRELLSQRRRMRQSVVPRGMLVTGGLVACPRAAGGDVELERCLGCTAIDTVVTDPLGRQWVQCRPRRNPLAPR